jgi:hypothetical protein
MKLLFLNCARKVRMYSCRDRTRNLVKESGWDWSIRKIYMGIRKMRIFRDPMYIHEKRYRSINLIAPENTLFTWRLLVKKLLSTCLTHTILFSLWTIKSDIRKNKKKNIWERETMRDVYGWNWIRRSTKWRCIASITERAIFFLRWSVFMYTEREGTKCLSHDDE